MTDERPGQRRALPRTIGAPATRALNAAGYSSLDSLAYVPVRQLQSLHGVGPKAIRILTEELAKIGLSLG